mgnify:CR=1 FL=1
MKKLTQKPRLQISTALTQDDYEALHFTQAKHGVSLGDIVREGCRSYNAKVAISETEMIRVIREGIKIINAESKDTTPADS